MNTDTRLIPLTQGKFAVVDACDYEWLNQWNWFANRIRTQFGDGWRAYRHTPRPSRKRIYMHRAVAERAGLPASREYDHIDHNPLNNTRQNLRPCTRSQNVIHRRKSLGTSSTYRGLTWVVGRRHWISRVKVNGRVVFRRRFATEIEAAKAYNEAAKLHHGEFAVLNEITEEAQSETGHKSVDRWRSS